MTASAMSQFAYRALRADGTPMSGIITARTSDDAARRLLEQGLFAIATREAPRHTKLGASPSLDDTAATLTTLGELLDAGLSPARALALLGDTAPHSWRVRLESARMAVSEGASVASALRDVTPGFPPVAYGLLSAGEAGLGLGQAAHRAGGLLRKQAELRHSILAALAYPALLLVTGSISAGLLTFVVLPRFADILKDLRVSLPLSTRVLLAAGGAATRSGGRGLLVLLAVALLVRWWKTTAQGADALSLLSVSTPGAGDVVRGLAVARAMETLSALLDGGVPISAALTYAAGAAGSRTIERRLVECREAVRGGAALSDALHRTRAATSTTERLCRAGEETGNLAPMLAHAAALDRTRAERKLRRLVGLIEPVLILGFGALIAFVASALFQAMYSVRPGT